MNRLLKDSLITVGILTVAVLVCFTMKMADDTSAYASMVFILVVFLVSRFTNGYFFGVFSAVASVLLVNFVFTFPYFEFNFTLSGYPVFILCMLTVSITTSTLITQNKQSQNARIEAELEKTRSNLLRAVSHDLRTPLTAINGICSVMIENDDCISADERKKLLGEMRDDAQWLIRMVENLLSITRIDGENAGIAKKPEIVEEVIADVAAKFRKHFPESSLLISIPQEPVFVPMDVMLIEQVLVNLLENAVIHSNGATKIWLSVQQQNDSVEFTVTDNGKGIPNDKLQHIFDGYFNKDYEQSADKKRSMGIGLSVCNTIIKAHGGSMSAENIKGGGAEFRFVLPSGKDNNDAE